MDIKLYSCGLGSGKSHLFNLMNESPRVANLVSLRQTKEDMLRVMRSTGEYGFFGLRNTIFIHVDYLFLGSSVKLIPNDVLIHIILQQPYVRDFERIRVVGHLDDDYLCNFRVVNKEVEKWDGEMLIQEARKRNLEPEVFKGMTRKYGGQLFTNGAKNVEMEPSIDYRVGFYEALDIPADIIHILTGYSVEKRKPKNSEAGRYI